MRAHPAQLGSEKQVTVEQVLASAELVCNGTKERAAVLRHQWLRKPHEAGQTFVTEIERHQG